MHFILCAFCHQSLHSRKGDLFYGTGRSYYPRDWPPCLDRHENDRAKTYKTVSCASKRCTTFYRPKPAHSRLWWCTGAQNGQDHHGLWYKDWCNVHFRSKRVYQAVVFLQPFCCFNPFTKKHLTTFLPTHTVEIYRYSTCLYNCVTKTLYFSKKIPLRFWSGIFSS